jgi:hypothetical protein
MSEATNAKALYRCNVEQCGHEQLSSCGLYIKGTCHECGLGIMRRVDAASAHISRAALKAGGK